MWLNFFSFKTMFHCLECWNAIHQPICLICNWQSYKFISRAGATFTTARLQVLLSQLLHVTVPYWKWYCLEQQTANAIAEVWYVEYSCEDGVILVSIARWEVYVGQSLNVLAISGHTSLNVTTDGFDFLIFLRFLMSYYISDIKLDIYRNSSRGRH